MKYLLTLVVLISVCSTIFAQERNKPIFPESDTPGEYGEWKTQNFSRKKGEDFSLSYRFKANGKFVMACLYSVEIKNNSDTKVKAYFVAGNKGTNYYAGEIGVVRKKLQINPGQTVVIDYRLPIPNNSKEDSEEIACKKCKENDHAFMFAE